MPSVSVRIVALEDGSMSSHLVSTTSFDAPPEGLVEWWVKMALDDLRLMMPKMKEYGAADLEAIGAALIEAGVRLPGGMAPAELGTLFYLIGKVSRMAPALGVGDAPSEDTLMDAEVYAKMCRRIRRVGGWPNKP